MKYTLHRHRHRITILFVLILLLGGVVFSWKNILGKSGEIAAVEQVGQSQVAGASTPKTVSSRTLSFGDLYWGGRVDDIAKATYKRVQYPFSNLASFSRQDYDAWIANLECPLTSQTVPSSDQEQTGILNCPKDYVVEAKNWFNILTLGNDHIDDQESVSGFMQTKEVLKNNGIQYLGHYDPKQYNDICEIVNLPARYRLNDGSYKQATMPLALCAINSNGTSPDNRAIDEIRNYSKILPTWVYAHMGDENTGSPSFLQQQIYHSYIDGGADVVIGSHTGRIQTAESYANKLIVYSLGDFIGSNSPAGSGRAMGLSIEISAELDQSVLLWTRLSPDCAGYDDACIETAAAQGLVRPNYSYTFSTVAVDNLGDGLVGRGSGEANEAIQQSLGWAAILLELKY